MPCHKLTPIAHNENIQVDISNTSKPCKTLKTPRRARRLRTFTHSATLPPVAANSATGPDNPARCRRTPSAPKTRFAGVFFCLTIRAMAAVRGRPSGLPGSCISGLSACAQLPPNSPDNECGSSHLIWEFYR